MNLDSYVSAIRSDARRLGACATVDLDAPVGSCPGWTVHDLIAHTGGVHRWAVRAIEAAAPPTVAYAQPDADATGADIEAWLVDGADRLADLLEAADPDAPTWHPFDLDQKMWVWSRRQAHETLVHRWDGEHAIGRTADLDPAHAADAVDEYFELGVPRVLRRRELPVPDRSLHVHCTDDGLPEGAGEWLVSNDGGAYRLERAHRKGDAALRGPAGDILLTLMGRTDADALDIVGDADAANAWLALGGW